MCVTLREAELSDTTLYAAEVDTPNGVRHVLGYQNQVQSLAKPTIYKQPALTWDSIMNPHASGVGNAMILPFPAKPGTMTKNSVISTEKCPNILKDMAEAIQPESQLMGSYAMRGMMSKGMEEAVVFEHGIYTVVLAGNPSQIPNALEQVPAHKRPDLNPEIFEAYEVWYPGWTIALCCFNNDQKRIATPLLWEYEPMHPSVLFLPGLDSHDGRAPKLDEPVHVDHTVIVSTRTIISHNHVNYTNAIPKEVKPYLASLVLGRAFSGKMRNGDFVCRIKEIEAGSFNPVRLAPPGASRREELDQ